MSGYYSVIQYSERPESGEFVNIGVAVFGGFGARAHLKFADTPRRVSRFYGNSLSSAEYKFLVDTFSRRVEAEFAKGVSKEQLEHFARMRSGKIRMVVPKAVLVDDAKATLSELFQMYLPDVPARKKRTERVQTKLTRELKHAEVLQFLDSRPKPETVFNGAEIKPSHSYQNGSLNLICPVRIKQDIDDAVDQASPYAVKGRELYRASKQAKRLVVVSDWEYHNKGEAEKVGNILHDHDVKFFTLDELDPLVDDIKRSYLLHRQ